MALIHGETRHDLHAPALVPVPEPLTIDDANAILANAAKAVDAAGLDDILRAAAKAGA